MSDVGAPSVPCILEIFHWEREGLRHLGEAIALHLNYSSLVSLKRTCRTCYHFFRNSNVEEIVFKRKLHHDWMVGTPASSKLQFLTSNLNTPVTNVKTVKNSEILFSTGKKIYQFDFQEDNTGEDGDHRVVPPELPDPAPTPGGDLLFGNVVNGMKLTLRLPSTSLNSKINTASNDEFSEHFKKVYVNDNENLERNQITQFDIMKNFVIAGNNNGMLTIWDLDTTELLNNKQLFGIITGVRCREEEDLIVTSHAGKSFDIGCISVRKMISPTELSVVWSAYQDIMPIFSFDCSSNYILTLEWLGTFEMVHVGSASLYTRGDFVYTRTEFSESLTEQESCSRRSPARVFSQLQHQNLRFSSVGIFNADEVSGIHTLLIWDLETKAVLQDISTIHKVGVFQVLSRGDILLTRDKNGLLCVWDSDLAASQQYKDSEPECQVLIRSLELPQREKILSSDLGLRRLLIGKIGGVEMLDFWNSST